MLPHGIVRVNVSLELGANSTQREWMFRSIRVNLFPRWWDTSDSLFDSEWRYLFDDIQSAKSYSLRLKNQPDPTDSTVSLVYERNSTLTNLKTIINVISRAPFFFYASRKYHQQCCYRDSRCSLDTLTHTIARNFTITSSTPCL